MGNLVAKLKSVPLWAITTICGTVLGTICYLVVERKWPGWIASRDKWDAAMCVIGAAFGGLTALAAMWDHFHRRALLDAVTVGMRGSLQARPRADGLWAELALTVTLRGAKRHSSGWLIRDPEVRIFGLDDLPLTTNRDVSEIGEDIAFVMAIEVPPAKALMLADAVRANCGELDVSKFHLGTNKPRRFDEPMFKCVVKVADEFERALPQSKPIVMVGVEEVRRSERERAVEAIALEAKARASKDESQRERLLHLLRRAYVSEPMVHLSGLGKCELMFKLIVHCAAEDIGSGNSIRGATVRIVDPHTGRQLAFAVVPDRVFKIQAPPDGHGHRSYEASITVPADRSVVREILGRFPHMATSVAVAEAAECVVQYVRTAGADQGAMHNISIDAQPVPLRVTGAQHLNQD